MKTVLINAYEGSVLFENVPNNKSRQHLINLAVHALNEYSSPNSRYLYSISNVDYIPNPILCEDEWSARQRRYEAYARYADRIQVMPEIVVDYPTFIAN